MNIDNSMMYRPNPLTDPGLPGPAPAFPGPASPWTPPIGTPWGGVPHAVPPLPIPSPAALRLIGSTRYPQIELPKVIQDILDLPVAHFETLPRTPAEGEKPLTNVAFILDRSSSMASHIDATIDGFNEQRKVVKAGAKLAGKTTFTETYFSDAVEIRRTAAGLRNLPRLDRDTYKPDGCTALYDALGATIAALLGTRRISSGATATLVTLFTDGGENASSMYTAHELAELIKRLEATGRWTFALVGPAGSVQGLAALLSVRPANVAGYNPASQESRQAVFGQMSAASTNYMSLRSMGVTQSACLYDPSQQ